MSMPEALIGGTLNAAAALGLSETHGSIEEGKFGDMIVINADRFVLLTVTSNLNISKTCWFEIAKENSNTCTIVFFVWKRKYYQNRCGSVSVG
jgi:urease alpha subunit